MTQGLMKYSGAQRTGHQMLSDCFFHSSCKRLHLTEAVHTSACESPGSAGPTPRVSGPVGLEGTLEFAFLTRLIGVTDAGLGTLLCRLLLSCIEPRLLGSLLD